LHVPGAEHSLVMVAVAEHVIGARARLSPGLGVTYSRTMTESPSDSALMLRYKDGDVAAFETLYRRHNDALYRYLLRCCLDRDAAEDVFQEVWGKIITSRGNYRRTAKFTTFLYRVAHNCFIDHLRRNRRHRGKADADPDHCANPADEPDLAAEKDLARNRLGIALMDLPDEQRNVFLLHEEAGLTIDNIAFVTGVNRETAKSRLRYAMNKLKAALVEPAELLHRAETKS
jgi:RNA polymerase sigma-70 factor (ECF subfamily)